MGRARREDSSAILQLASCVSLLCPQLVLSNYLNNPDGNPENKAFIMRDLETKDVGPRHNLGVRGCPTASTAAVAAAAAATGATPPPLLLLRWRQRVASAMVPALAAAAVPAVGSRWHSRGGAGCMC